MTVCSVIGDTDEEQCRDDWLHQNALPLEGDDDADDDYDDGHDEDAYVKRCKSKPTLLIIDDDRQT